MSSSVVATLHNDGADRCVKIVRQPDGTFGFQEFRRDPEDAGGWTLVRDNARGACATEARALAVAQNDVAWLCEQRLRQRSRDDVTCLSRGAELTLSRWHGMVEAGDLSGVATLCAPDAVFRSPVAFTPYQGAPLVAQFLQQALQAFEEFRYHRTFSDGESSVVLEFSAKIGDKELKGVDIIRFDSLGRIEEFEVMVRPASALQALGAEMARRMTPILAVAKSA